MCLLSSEESKSCCSSTRRISDATAIPAVHNYYSGINEAVNYTAALLLRPEDSGQRPKMKSLVIFSKFKMLKTRNLLEVFEEKFPLLTANPVHGFWTFCNILSLNIPKFPVCSLGHQFGLDLLGAKRAAHPESQLHVPQDALSDTCQQENCCSIPFLPILWICSALFIEIPHPASKPKQGN